MNEIVINQTALQIKEYNGKRVVTFKEIDAVHERPEGTAKRNFATNKKHFIEGEDYFKICVDEIRTNKIFDISPKTQSDVILITETGYLMLVKSFTDDFAWTVQRQLVNTYFQVKQMLDYESCPNTKLLTVKDYIHNTCKELGMNEPILTDFAVCLRDIPRDFYILQAWDALLLIYRFAPDSKAIIIDEKNISDDTLYIRFRVHLFAKDNYFETKFNKKDEEWELSELTHHCPFKREKKVTYYP
ncbi:MAG: ORF6N domain-containing protein [Oscillospiraceae bacterium]|nr:ORF6N domain-containing protein [Oscillospiraceae bacterium]